MSRIGRKPIPVPAGVDVKIDGSTVRVTGPKGHLERALHRDMIIRYENGHIVVERPSENKLHKSLHGLTRTLISNMVLGVTQGFQKSLELVGVGYRASKQGNKLILAVGYSKPVEIEPDAGLAASVRSVREPEPYKGKGIKYEGERIRRKVGKAGGKGKK